MAVLEHILNYIGWPEFECLRFVCRNCFDWLEFLTDLQWRVLAKKLLRHWHAEAVTTWLDRVVTWSQQPPINRLFSGTDLANSALNSEDEYGDEVTTAMEMNWR